MLNRKLKYLQVALNSTLDEAENIIEELPPSERIIIEAGTPLIKQYGMYGVSKVVDNWGGRISATGVFPYVVADLKTIDRGETEVGMVKHAGASAAIASGSAPIETLDVFINSCEKYGIDSMVDMMNVDQPIKTLRKLKKIPQVVVLHRGVDEEKFNKDKPIPYIQINKVRSSYNTLIAIAGGDTIREVQRAIFNDANIVVVWKEFFKSSENTAELAQQFLKEIK